MPALSCGDQVFSLAWLKPYRLKLFSHPTVILDNLQLSDQVKITLLGSPVTGRPPRRQVPGTSEDDTAIRTRTGWSLVHMVQGQDGPGTRYLRVRMTSGQDGPGSEWVIGWSRDRMVQGQNRS